MKPFAKLGARSEEIFINGNEATTRMNDLVSNEAVRKNFCNVYDLWFFKVIYLFIVFLKNTKNRKIFIKIIGLPLILVD